MSFFPVKMTIHLSPPPSEIWLYSGIFPPFKSQITFTKILLLVECFPLFHSGHIHDGSFGAKIQSRISRIRWQILTVLPHDQMDCFLVMIGVL